MSNDRVIPNGTFTVMSARTGEHRTFKIVKSKNGKPRWVMLMTGPDNERSFKSFALVSEDNRRIFVFNKNKGTKDDPSIYEKYACLLECMLTRQGDEWYTERGYTIEGSKKCARCGRKLTEPQSLITGIGPVCAGRQ